MHNNIINLGPRLQAIASYIRRGSLPADIGTDHAYLPVYLVQQGIIRRAVGVDVHEGPYRSASETVQAYGLKDLIDVRMGDGLKPLQPGEADVLVLAGMGGNTILQILTAREDVLRKVQELVLQPQGAEGKVRRELLAKGWKIKDELLVEEEGRIYTVILLTRDEGLDYDAVESKIQELRREIKAFLNSGQAADGNKPFRDNIGMSKQRIFNEQSTVELLAKILWGFGPIIIQQKNELLKSLLDAEIARLQKVTLEMQRTGRQEIEDKSLEMQEEIKMLEVFKQCRFQ